MTARRLFTGTLLALLLGIAAPAARAGQACCENPDNGSGTATLPPTAQNAGCFYLGSMEIVDGLPPGSTIQINAALGNFTSVTEAPGGILGGTTSPGFNVQLNMFLTGTGGFTGYSRNIILNLANGQIDWAPRAPYAPTQGAPAEYMNLFGQLPPGDPDFDLLRITGGDLYGYPSPGYIQLTAAGSNWAAAGFFDLWHRIDFVGHIPGPFSGMSGSTVRQRHFLMCEEPTAVEAKTWSGIKSLLVH